MKEKKTYIKKYLMIKELNDLTEFVKKAREVDGEVTVFRGRYIIDGKSLMGMMSIEVSQGFSVEYPEEAKDFEDFLTPFLY